MERQPESEQVQRLTVKTVDQVFIARALEGLGCSLFEAEALTELVKVIMGVLNLVMSYLDKSHKVVPVIS